MTIDMIATPIFDELAEDVAVELRRSQIRETIEAQMAEGRARTDALADRVQAMRPPSSAVKRGIWYASRCSSLVAVVALAAINTFSDQDYGPMTERYLAHATNTVPDPEPCFNPDEVR